MEVNRNTKAKGLENIGATCYMNAVLQCFFHVKPLTNELLKYNTFPGMFMTNAFKDVISQLASNSSYPAKPELFKSVISQNPLFTGIQANDSKDLVLYFLENIERELSIKNFFCNEVKYLNRIKNINIDPYDRKNAPLMNIINAFHNEHKSIISDLFYGFMSQEIQCNICHESILNYTIFNLIIFPIQAVYESANQTENESLSLSKNTTGRRNPYTSNSEYGSFTKPSFYNGYTDYSSNNRNRNNSYNYNRTGKKSVTLYECFDREIQDFSFEKENKIFCNNCRRLVDAKSKNKIYCSPHVLILVLNRGKGNQFDCDVEFEEKIDISKYIEKKDCPLKYNLIGVISHFGESSMNGHFIADCKHFDGKWYSFSDSSVTGPSSFYSKRGTPYILFYQNSQL